MATITTVIENFFKDKIRVIKSLTWGKNAETADYASSGGIDFNPPKNTKGIFIKTGNSSQPICIGYILKSAIDDLGEGETALFSIDGTDTPATIKARKNGDLEMNGNSDFMVRFSALETAYNATNDKLNDLIDKYNAHVHPGVTVGTSSTLITTSIETPSTGDISGAKIDNVKTN